MAGFYMRWTMEERAGLYTWNIATLSILINLVIKKKIQSNREVYLGLRSFEFSFLELLILSFCHCKY